MRSQKRAPLPRRCWSFFDAGDYGAVWDAGGFLMHESFERDTWVEISKSIYKQTGSLIRRELEASVMAPGSHGQYERRIMRSYLSEYQGIDEVKEGLFLVKEDSGWHVQMYLAGDEDCESVMGGAEWILQTHEAKEIQ